MSDAAPSAKRKSRATASSSKDDSAQDDNLALVRCIQNIQQFQVNFTDAIKRAEDLIGRQFSDLELRIQGKRRELDALDETFATKERSLRVQMELDMRAHGRATAVGFLERLQPPETAIVVSEWSAIQSRLAELEKSMADTIRANRDTETAKANAEFANWKMQVELQHKAVLAEQGARCTQLSDHIKVLEKQIQQLHDDVAKQRQLTKDVADAARPMAQQQPMMRSN
jgi:hypothetical protein